MARIFLQTTGKPAALGAPWIHRKLKRSWLTCNDSTFFQKYKKDPGKEIPENEPRKIHMHPYEGQLQTYIRERSACLKAKSSKLYGLLSKLFSSFWLSTESMSACDSQNALWQQKASPDTSCVDPPKRFHTSTWVTGRVNVQHTYSSSFLFLVI